MDIFTLFASALLMAEKAPPGDDRPVEITKDLPQATLLDREAAFAKIATSYPSINIPRAMQGDVTVRATVNLIGRVAECVVERSSGHRILDQWACRGLTRYARFRPASDGCGNPLESQWSGTIRLEYPPRPKG